MSEYQYFEFLAIDRLLDERDQAALRRISSRAQITSISFAVHYDFGDLKANPLDMVRRWFDVHVYSGFFMDRRLMIRLPRRLFDPAEAIPFQRDGGFSVVESGENVVLLFDAQEMDGTQADDEAGWMTGLSRLREGLLVGDRRCLYLDWLRGVQDGVVDDGAWEPFPPPGLGQLDGALAAFSDFFDIDPDLVTASAAGSPRLATDPLTPAALETFVRDLPVEDKTELLLRSMRGEVAVITMELRRRCRDALRPAETIPAHIERRTAGDLRRLAALFATERERHEAERIAAETAARAEEAAKIRAVRIERLARRGDGAWREVEDLIDQRIAQAYERAIDLLLDLRALAVRDGTTAAFAKRLTDIRVRHARKSTFIERLIKTGLTG